MQIEIVDKKIDEIQADIELVFVLEKDFNHRFVKDNDALKLLNFKGDTDEVGFLPVSGRVYVGVGEKKCEPFSDAAAAGIKKLLLQKQKQLKLQHIAMITSKQA
jgi:leucyl aminopeptidase